MKVIEGKRIVDLSRIIAGPYATMVLADFGCEVIKIEAPEGDPTRQWGPPWHEDQSAYFLSINRNKKSLALNLKEPKCR
jgi:crotonobetainyl-CoA:carnitine CoA-transferase CaiB-like acyl-CoA transferase